MLYRLCCDGFGGGPVYYLLLPSGAGAVPAKWHKLIVDTPFRGWLMRSNCSPALGRTTRGWLMML